MNHVPLKKLQESGLLFEINRQILNPLGYSLVMKIDHKVQEGPQESLVLMNTNDSEGVLYPEEAFIDGATRFSNFMKTEGESRITRRLNTIGYIRQSRSDQ
jgi:hypothetical protein